MVTDYIFALPFVCYQCRVLVKSQALKYSCYNILYHYHQKYKPVHKRNSSTLCHASVLI